MTHASFSPARATGTDDGFTLIEIIAALVILGIIMAFGGLALLQGVQAFALSRETTATGQRVQMAMNRITMELKRADAITTAQAGSVTFTSVSREPGTSSTISLAGDKLTLQTGTLLENVTGVLFEYENKDAQPWTVGQPFENLAGIAITLTVSLPGITGVDSLEFSSWVNVRNNGMVNGPKYDLS